MKKNIVMVLVIVALAIGGAGFFGGMKYQQNKQPSRTNFQAMRDMRQSGMSGVQQGGNSGMIRGEIIEQDEESVTIKLLDDSSKIILISENTEINKTTEGFIGDLEIGEQLMVFGQTNSDGSISATNIQLGSELIRRDQ